MSNLSHAIKRAYYCHKLGIETPFDDLMKVTALIKSKISKIDRRQLYQKYLNKKLIKKYFKNNIFLFKDIKLPDIRNNEQCMGHFPWVFYDILFFYTERNDDYNKKDIDKYEQYFADEGSYLYKDENFEMSIKPNDIVIDAGAWIGPFSAYASKKGALVYAFEPSIKNRSLLEQTAQLNGNINVVPYGLYDQETTINFSDDSISSRVDGTTDNHNKISTITLDSFVQKNNIKKIDFIKSDIEGAERNFLRGAVWVLKNFAPKLSICTYHLPDDPIVLAKIIIDANPNYKIIQRKRKLFAIAKNKITQ